MNRRTFIRRTGSVIVTAGGFASCARRPSFGSNPFTLGVASGDPLPDGVVLWTRLALDPLNGGGMPRESFTLTWEIARDDTMRDVVQRGTTVATPDYGHSVHVEVDGLESDRWYWYRFHGGGEESVVGRTHTTPLRNAPTDRLRFAFASCQHYEQGLYTALGHLAEEDVDLVVHLGDYIYEDGGSNDRVRRHTGNEIQSLDDYRNRYALYKSDPALQAAHAAFPWLLTSDDHEVDNNYAGAVSEHADVSRDVLLARRTNAYRAYYEHMPLRTRSLPSGPDMQLYRAVSFGSLARFFVLDTRQYRSDQSCGDRNKPTCSEMYVADRTLMGTKQEAWLDRELTSSTAQWNVLAQQVMVAPVDRAFGSDEVYSMDQWGGYPAALERLVESLHTIRPANPVVLTGDIHSNWVNDIKKDFRDMSSQTLATELVGTSLSSGGDGREAWDSTADILSENPFVRWFNGQRGYVRCDVTKNMWRADYRIVPYVTRPGSGIETRRSFVVEDGRAGAQVA